MHKLTNNDIVLIQELATALPPVQRLVTKQYTGTQLIEMGIHTHQGRPVDPLCSYQVETIKVANLVKVLQDLVREQGIETLSIVVDHLKEGRPIITKYGTVQMKAQAAA
jgi:hypothetical protein